MSLNQSSVTFAAVTLWCVTVIAFWGHRHARSTVTGPRSVPAVAVATRSSVAAVRSLRGRTTIRDGYDFAARVAELRNRGISEAEIRTRVTEEVQTIFRREQYRVELALEQSRYPKNYWEPSASIETRFALERARQAALVQIDREQNAVLEELFGPSVPLPPPRNPIFGDENPGPNLGFLSDASRDRLLDEFLARDPNGALSSLEREAIANRILPPADAALYAKWNSPTAAALGTMLVGFQPTRAEYDAIFQWQVGAGGELGFANDEVRAEASDQLTQALGPERYALFERMQDPTYQTVVQMLNRWGLPLSSADDVVELRRTAIDVISAVQQDANMTEGEKSARVAQAEQYYRAQIAAQLGIHPGDVPDEDLL